MTKKTDNILSIIIVSYNTADLTVQTLKSVKSSLDKSPNLQSKTEIFVIDNNSQDDSLKKIYRFEKIFPKFKIIENKDNRGFASANNQAAKLATGKYLLLLNSDTIVQRKALEILIDGAEQNDFKITASLLLNRDHSIQPQGGNLPSLTTLFNHMFFLDDLPLIGKFFPSTQSTGLNFVKDEQHQTCHGKEILAKEIGWVGGTAMLICKDLWNMIGPLDEKIFMYGEDIELCLRAKKLGVKIGIIESSLIVHLGSASSSSKNALIGELQGYKYIWDKHKPSWQKPFLNFILYGGILLRIVLFSWILGDPRGKIYKEALTKI
ncbi:MAG: glycosyltransferase family 2 protein [Candidatus Pacebacteria bacterium]|nr:glycosyltransferase family 2 protein [Candidatus Paceibacterota bacterium]